METILNFGFEDFFKDKKIEKEVGRIILVARLFMYRIAVFPNSYSRTVLKLPLQILIVQRLLEPCLRPILLLILLAVKRLSK